MPAVAGVVMKLGGDKGALERGESGVGHQGSLLGTAPQFSRSFSYVEGPASGQCLHSSLHINGVERLLRRSMLCSTATPQFVATLCQQSKKLTTCKWDLVRCKAKPQFAIPRRRQLLNSSQNQTVQCAWTAAVARPHTYTECCAVWCQV